MPPAAVLIALDPFAAVPLSALLLDEMLTLSMVPGDTVSSPAS